MTEQGEVRRGDVVLATIRFPSAPDESKARPVLIVQNDIGNRFSPNVIVAGISSQLPSRPYPTDLIVRRGSELHVGSGLDRDSVVQAANIATLRKRAISRRIGRFSEAAMREIDQCLRVSLGLV